MAESLKAVISHGLLDGGGDSFFRSAGIAEPDLQSNNSPFSTEEQALISESLTSLRQELRSKFREHSEEIDEKFDQIDQQLSKLGRADWFKFFIAQLANIAVRVALSLPDVQAKIQAVWDSIGGLFLGG